MNIEEEELICRVKMLEEDLVKRVNTLEKALCEQAEFTNRIINILHKMTVGPDKSKAHKKPKLSLVPNKNKE